VEKLERKRSVRGTRCRWKDNIKMDLKGTGFAYVSWIHMTLKDSCEHGNETSSSIKGGEFLLSERLLDCHEGLQSTELEV
jgi:hypothetical protein